ncbi:MAG: hypothetical protein EHM58_05720 [Ignavibacteriae bacterium]|nr:MAG: hypothetical protein EHM58_05720 [Ignavibacteriota bacterium]
MKFAKPAVALLIFVCFALPFMNLTCGGQTILTLNAYNLTFGTSYSPSGGLDFGSTEKKSEKIGPDAIIIGAFVLALCILVFSFFNTALSRNIYMIGGFLSFILILVFRFKTGSEIQQGGQTIGAEFAYGFYITAAMFLIIGILGVLTLKPKAPVTAAVENPEKIPVETPPAV